MENKWFDSLPTISNLLRSSGIKHVFIKNLVDPFEYGDIDVLIACPSELVKARKLIEAEGFKPVSAGAYSPPLKICLVKERITVELYPEAMWKKKVVADGKEIISRRVSFSINGTEFYVPSPEDDFHLISTHAISHMRITRTEMENTRRICEGEFNWNLLKKLAFDFGTQASSYFFIRALAFYCRVPILKDFHPLVRIPIDAWFEKENPNFPISVPKFFGRLLPALCHTPSSARRLEARKIFGDFISNFL